jgi:hypothetical protein
MTTTKIYPGIDEDKYGGMTDVGRIIRDAWLFDLIPESERCVNWSFDQIQNLYDRVSKAWEPYGHLVSSLPPELLEKHARINGEAVRIARESGWDPDLSDES